MSLWSEAKAEQVLGVHGWGAKWVMISHLLSYTFNPGSLLEVAGTSNSTNNLCAAHDGDYPLHILRLFWTDRLIQLLIYLAYTVLSSQNSDLVMNFVVNNNKMQLLNEGLVLLH